MVSTPLMYWLAIKMHIYKNNVRVPHKPKIPANKHTNTQSATKIDKAPLALSIMMAGIVAVNKYIAIDTGNISFFDIQK